MNESCGALYPREPLTTGGTGWFQVCAGSGKAAALWDTTRNQWLELRAIVVHRQSIHFSDKQWAGKEGFALKDPVSVQ